MRSFKIQFCSKINLPFLNISIRAELLDHNAACMLKHNGWNTRPQETHKYFDTDDIRYETI